MAQPTDQGLKFPHLFLCRLVLGMSPKQLLELSLGGENDQSYREKVIQRRHAYCMKILECGFILKRPKFQPTTTNFYGVPVMKVWCVRYVVSRVGNTHEKKKKNASFQPGFSAHLRKSFSLKQTIEKCP